MLASGGGYSFGVGDACAACIRAHHGAPHALRRRQARGNQRRRFPAKSLAPCVCHGNLHQAVSTAALPPLPTRAPITNKLQFLSRQEWSAAVNVQPLCGDVYVHAGVIEVLCAADMVAKAVTLLADQIGVEHIEIKEIMETKNFAGRAILGTGPLASSPSQSLVLSNIDVSQSVIGVSDTGINMNNCFFYDNGKIANSRVVHDYNFLPGSMCGRTVPCGNMLDEQGHGTHVAGTVCGNAATNAAAEAGNGIAVGAKVFFTDIHNENILSPPSNLANLFQPAYNAGVYVHLLPPFLFFILAPFSASGISPLFEVH